MALVPDRPIAPYTRNRRFRFAGLATDLRSMALVLLCLLLAGCPLAPPSPYQFAERLSAHVVHIPHPTAPQGGLSRGGQGYNLYVALASIGLDVSTGKSH